MPWRVLLALAVGVILYLLIYQEIGLGGVLGLDVLISLISGFPHLMGLFVTWRDMKNAEEQLQSWDDVITDYRAITETDESRP